MNNEILLRPISDGDLRELWNISYGPDADLKWMQYNGPYFNDPVQTWEEFSSGYGKKLINNPMYRIVVVNNKIIGSVSAYWKDTELRQWLDIGIVIYDATMWGKGYGTIAFSKWIKILFSQFDYLPHIGFTTWSGNKGMQKVGDNCNMIKEGTIRKVRYWNEKYYDSVMYGILREEVK